MGTDINGVFQKRNKQNEWVDIDTKYEFNRHYQLFAFIGGVRNGTGFAGVKTGESVSNPVAACRGVPEDMQVDEYGNCGSTWLGDHSYSWFKVNEYFAHIEAAGKVIKTGIVSKERYEDWINRYPDPDNRSAPDSHCGGIWGRDVILINDDELEKRYRAGWTHIQVKWVSDLREELQYFTEELHRLVQEHQTDEIRFVFGFDS